MATTVTATGTRTRGQRLEQIPGRIPPGLDAVRRSGKALTGGLLRRLGREVHDARVSRFPVEMSCTLEPWAARRIGAASPGLITTTTPRFPSQASRAIFSTPTISTFSTVFPGERAPEPRVGGGLRVERDDFPTVLSSTQVLLFVPSASHAEPRRYLHPGQHFAHRDPQADSGYEARASILIPASSPPECASLMGRFRITNLLWAAVSRAVRARPDLNRDLFEVVGPVVYIRGGDFQAEKLTAYDWATARSLPRTARFRSRHFITSTRTFEAPSSRRAAACPPCSPMAWRATPMGVEVWATTN